MIKFYGVTADCLLGFPEIKNHSDAELDDLHLSDDMIELLSTKSKPLRALNLLLPRLFRLLFEEFPQWSHYNYILGTKTDGWDHYEAELSKVEEAMQRLLLGEEAINKNFKNLLVLA